MAKKEPTWITGKEAAAILQKKNNRPINDRYIRRMAASGKIDFKKITERLNLYSKEDIETHVLSERVGRQARSEASKAAC